MESEVESPSRSKWPSRFRAQSSHEAEVAAGHDPSIRLFRLYVDEEGGVAGWQGEALRLQTPDHIQPQEVEEALESGASHQGKSYDAASGGLFAAAIGASEMDDFIATSWEPNAWTKLDLDAATSDGVPVPAVPSEIRAQTTLYLVYRPTRPLPIPPTTAPGHDGVAHGHDAVGPGQDEVGPGQDEAVPVQDGVGPGQDEVAPGQSASQDATPPAPHTRQPRTTRRAHVATASRSTRRRMA